MRASSLEFGQGRSPAGASDTLAGTSHAHPDQNRQQHEGPPRRPGVRGADSGPSGVRDSGRVPSLPVDEILATAALLDPGDSLVVQRLGRPDQDGKEWRIGRSIGGQRG